MLKVLIAALFLFAITACSTVCDISKSVSSAVSSTIATKLDCKNLTAVQKSVDDQLSKLKVCESKTAAKSAIGQYVCAPLVTALAGAGVSQLPKEWECSGGSVTEDLRTQLIAACEKAI